MQLNKLYAFLIYLGSYLPLSIILLAQDLNFPFFQKEMHHIIDSLHSDPFITLKNPFPSIIVVITCALCFLSSIIAINILPKKRRIKIIESKHIPSDLINYVIPYVVSFASIDYADPGKNQLVLLYSFLGFSGLLMRLVKS